MPSAPDIKGAVKRDIFSIPADQCVGRPITYRDLRFAFASVSSSYKGEQISNHLRWAKENGTGN